METTTIYVTPTDLRQIASSMLEHAKFFESSYDDKARKQFQSREKSIGIAFEQNGKRIEVVWCPEFNDTGIDWSSRQVIPVIESDV